MKISDKSINHFLTNKVTEEIPITNKNKEKILCNHCMRTLSNESQIIDRLRINLTK